MELTISNVLDKYRSLLDEARVLDSITATILYGQNTLGSKKRIAGALFPLNVSEIIAIVKLARTLKTSLYPISTGKNWGYGGPTPVNDQCVILDLSKMNKILDMDESLGLVTLQPGVTQGQLHQFLEQHHFPFMAPVTGSSDQCSVVGNALDRGFGINPHTDHFAAIMSLEAILPSGELYRSPLIELNGKKSGKIYKWGLGPYLDGLFAQSNFGIITSMTIALAPKPEHIESFFFNLNSDQELFNLIDPLRKIVQTVGPNMGSVKITSQHQLLAAMKFKKRDEKNLPLSTLLDAHHIYPWLGFGAIYGDFKVVKAIKKYTQSRLKPYTKKLIFLNQRTVNIANKVLNTIPILKKTPLIKLSEVTLLLKFLHGIPHSGSMSMAYFGTEIPKNESANWNPDKDGCGLIWFTPLVPFKSVDIQQVVPLIKKILENHGLQATLTMTNLASYGTDLTIPLLFDAKNPCEVENAHHCYEMLFTECQKLGYLPYRLPTEFMSLLTENVTSRTLSQQIKKAVDPTNILSPGRYS